MDYLTDTNWNNIYSVIQKSDHSGNMTDFSSSSHSVWNQFFLSAGIPDNVANEYAITFSQHRIRIDMLKEITKEILCDMGIRAMGDIIAILRHAKNLCRQDELKSNIATPSSALKSPIALTKSVSRPSPARPHITDRITQKPSVGTSSKAPINSGNQPSTRIQSRLSLSSGALTTSNRRPIPTSISDSLAKRLRPAPSDDAFNPAQEKTLVVHYPSRAAIAKARQRISGKPGPSDEGSSSNSIKSRLDIKSRNRSRPYPINRNNMKKKYKSYS